MQLVEMMINKINIRMVNPVAPALPVLCWKTATTGYPVALVSVFSKSPIQNTYVMSTIKAGGMFIRYESTMDLGTTTPASWISSAM